MADHVPSEEELQSQRDNAEAAKRLAEERKAQAAAEKQAAEKAAK